MVITPAPKQLQMNSHVRNVTDLAPFIDPDNQFGGSTLFTDYVYNSSTALWMFRALVSAYATLGLLTTTDVRTGARVPMSLSAWETAHGSLVSLTVVPRWNHPLVESLVQTLTAYHATNADRSVGARTTMPYLFAMDPTGGTVLYPMALGAGQSYAYPFFTAKAHVLDQIENPGDSTLSPIWTYRRRSTDARLCLERWENGQHTADGTEVLHHPMGYATAPWPN